MADDVIKMLTWMASYSKFFSVLVVLMCFLVTLVLILRLNSNQMFWPLPVSPLPLVPRREMMKLLNPFVLTVQDLESTELQNCIEMRLSCQYPCLLTCLWSVGIDQIHKAIQKPSHEVMIDLNSREFLKTSAGYVDNIDIPEPCTNRTVVVKCPVDIEELKLGKPPRQKYPLGITLCLQLGLQDVDVADSDVVLSIYILHLKDKDCPMKSQLIGHYIKLYNGNVLNLQHLFLSSDESTSDSPGRRAEKERYVDDGEENIPELQNGHSTETFGNTGLEDCSDSSCIVCQAAPITTVLLPCRHTCVCNTCFLQIDKCPMCRSVIDSYFRLPGVPDGDPSLLPDDEGRSVGILSKWARWNHRLNQYLGFTE